MPRYPSFPGISSESTSSLRMCRSGVTTCSSIFSGRVAIAFVSLGECSRELRRRARRQLFRLLAHFFDRADHVERLLRQIVVLAFHDFLEAAHGVFDLH